MPAHCPEQLVETEKLRWRWDSELVNDRESESFGWFDGGGSGGGSGGGGKEEKQHGDRCVLGVRRERVKGCRCLLVLVVVAQVFCGYVGLWIEPGTRGSAASAC